MQNFCFTSAEQTIKDLGTTQNGLTDEQAQNRLAKYGKNEIEQGKRAGIFKLFFSQFKDFMTLLLIAAAGVSAVIAYLSKDKNDLTDTFIIIFIIFLNAVVGTVQQYRADKAIENLKKLSTSTVKAKRGGKDIVLDSTQVTIGDILMFEEGDIIPADCRIIESNNLKCDESPLTGESMAVEKNSDSIKGNKVALGDMKNTLFNSTFVVGGSCKGVVTAVGMGTEMGKIATMLKEEKTSATPLEKSLNKFGKIISSFVLLVTAVIFIFGLFVGKRGILANFMTSVAVAVAAIPEGLPAVVTIIMAMGVQRMSKKNVVIRKLKSVETLGGCTVICSDKTGTLTQNKMQVTKIYCENSGKSKLFECMSACSSVKGNSGNYIGDPTEIALKVKSNQEGVFDNYKKFDELPFSSERKMMTVAACFGGEKYNYVKGAFDILLSHCTRILTDSGVRTLTDSDKSKIIEQNNLMTDDALRVLGFAYSKYDGQISEEKLIFIGLCGMTDGIKEGVEESVKECKNAGVRAVMITGDHVRTAFSIAKKLGIADNISQVITGEELDALPKKERDKKMCECCVFARVSPKHKNMIVKALKNRGEVVAMTGDGINDAPSIKSADIGIAMGIQGTDVTKSASDMVVADDNFTAIVGAVREGRRISANIRKTIQFFISTNLAEVLAILIASLVFFKNDFLLSTQLLWLNLITDSFPVLALGLEKEDNDIMKTPPIPAEKSLFSKVSLLSICFFGVYITSLTVGVYAVGIKLWGSELATGVTFITLSFFELFHAFNIRSEKQSLFKCGIFSNKVLIITVILGIAVNILLSISPFAAAFGLAGLTPLHWLIAAALSFSIIPTDELFKLILRHSKF